MSTSEAQKYVRTGGGHIFWIRFIVKTIISFWLCHFAHRKSQELLVENFPDVGYLVAHDMVRQF